MKTGGGKEKPRRAGTTRGGLQKKVSIYGQASHRKILELRGVGAIRRGKSG